MVESSLPSFFLFLKEETGAYGDVYMRRTSGGLFSELSPAFAIYASCRLLALLMGTKVEKGYKREVFLSFVFSLPLLSPSSSLVLTDFVLLNSLTKRKEKRFLFIKRLSLSRFFVFLILFAF